MTDAWRWKKYAACDSCGALVRRGCRKGGVIAQQPCVGRKTSKEVGRLRVRHVDRVPSTVEAQHRRLLALNDENAALKEKLAAMTKRAIVAEKAFANERAEYASLAKTSTVWRIVGEQDAMKCHALQDRLDRALKRIAEIHALTR